MRFLPLAVYALACAFSAFAQVSVREAATKAHLVNAKTNISVALTNATSKPLDATILLEWLAPDDTRQGFTRTDISVAPGDSSVDIVLPLSDKFDPLLGRLRYEIRPAERNYTSFAPVTGILSFVHIADYAFALNILSAARPRPGKSFEIPVLTFHPVTRAPVSGVEVRSEKSTAVSDKNGVARLRIQVPAEADTDSLEFQIDAHLGDFHQSDETAPLTLTREEIRIYTDKPLYQPGQTMHVRIIALSGAGPVRAETEHEIRIEDEDQDVVHAETVTTSRFGVASTDWEIPPNAKSGEYRIEVDRDDLDSPYSRTVPIRRYELPSFRVSAKPERPFYFLHQTPAVEISGEYLFGKPVTSGTTRITEGDDDKTLVEGKLSVDGRFRATLDATSDLGGERYLDRHFTAFVTDASTNRTEQRKFDIRVTRDPLHIYVGRQEPAPEGLRLFISVYSPDGAPVTAQVEVATGSQVMATGRTNRFGLTRIDVPRAKEGALIVAAVGPDGTRAEEPITPDYGERDLWLDTDHVLYRSGQPVRCRVSAARRDGPVILMAWNAKGETVYEQVLVLAGGSADVVIPYDARFGRELSIGVASGPTRSTATRKVIFPAPDDLTVRAIPAKATYRPGDTATVQFRASAESALGIAVVDQSVLERATTDESF